MKKRSKKRAYMRRLVPALLLVAVLAIAGPALAQSETGNVCVRDYNAGATCTSNDVRLERLEFVNVITPCSGPGTTATVVFDALLSADGSPDRYDIGFFIATDGSSHDQNLDSLGQVRGALGGDSCYHDYLDGGTTASPAYTLDTLPIGNPDGVLDTTYDADAGFTGWWNGGTDLDACGDIETNRAALARLDPITIACVDNDGDGAVDISVCSSWDNNTNTPQGPTCDGVANAFPGTPAKCGCSTVNLPFTPTAVTIGDASATASQTPVLPLVILFAVLVGAILFVSFRRRPLPGEDL